MRKWEQLQHTHPSPAERGGPREGRCRERAERVAWLEQAAARREQEDQYDEDEDLWPTSSSEEDEEGQPVKSPVSSGRLGADAEQQESEPGPPAPFEWAGP